MAANRRVGSGPADAGRDAAGRDPLEPSLDGAGEATRPRPFIASGGPSACSRIARRPSSCRAIPSSWRRSATSSGIWRRRIVRSLCRRKEPDPGLRPFPAPLADAPRAGGAGSHDLARPLSSRPRHRHGRAVSRDRARGRKFLDLVERTSLKVHIVMDNYGTHKIKAIRDCSQRPAQAHFTPTAPPGSTRSSAGSGCSTNRSGAASIHQGAGDYIDTTNQNPKPFKWTKSAYIRRLCQSKPRTPGDLLAVCRTLGDRLESRRKFVDERNQAFLLPPDLRLDRG